MSLRDLSLSQRIPMMLGAGTRFYRSAVRPAVAVFLSLTLLWVLALSVSPQLHERIHADAGQTEHHCGVTLIASGNCEHITAQPLLAAKRPPFKEAILAPLAEARVSFYHGPALLEHAPPAHS